MSWLSKLLKLRTAWALPAVSAAAAKCITSAMICPRWPAMPAHAVHARIWNASDSLSWSDVRVASCSVARFAAQLEGSSLLLQSHTVYPHNSYKPAPLLKALHGGQTPIAMAHVIQVLGLEPQMLLLLQAANSMVTR